MCAAYALPRQYARIASSGVSVSSGDHACRPTALARPANASSRSTGQSLDSVTGTPARSSVLNGYAHGVRVRPDALGVHVSLVTNCGWSVATIFSRAIRSTQSGGASEACSMR